MNNNTQDFTWPVDNIKIENEAPPFEPATTQYALSEADLYQLLLGDEIQQQQQQQQQHQNQHQNQQYSTFTDSISGDPSEDTVLQEKIKKKKSNDNKPPASSTGKLDFRPAIDCIPESQLKAMTSKERRQLRNKISARNFRNRRKEYIGNIEDELNQQKAENSQLKLEIKWLRNNMEKMQKENDRLRMELMMTPRSHESDNSKTSSPPTIQIDNNLIESTPYILDSTSLINSSMNLSSFTNSSDESSGLPSPPNLFNNFPDNWDFVLPNDSFLSHALVPNWNLNHVLSKETSTVVQAPSMFQQYPLLAPALMSIVLNHTMTMSTDDLLATAKLTPPSVGPYSPHEKKHTFSNSNTISQKEARAVWDMLEPLRHMNERNEKLSLSKNNNQKNTMVILRSSETGGEEFCSMTWLRDCALGYLCHIVASITSENSPQPQLITQSQSIQQDPQQEDPLKKKFILCRKYQEAVRYITASS